MPWLIGIDEAGYGPNLGPLVIGASAWRVDDPSTDLYDTLGQAVSADPNDERVAIADSKRLYKPGGGWRLLERGVLGALRSSGAAVADSEALIAELAAEPAVPHDGHADNVPWRRGEPLPLPADATEQDIADAADLFTTACDDAGISRPVVRARLVQPDEFNTLVAKHGTNGAALSHVTIALLRGVIDETATDEPVSCVLDKHGGRNRYAGLVQHYFPEHWIETLTESRSESRYRTTFASGAPIELAFRSGGEAFLPTALASMTAKLLREIEMRRFNAFWRRHLPGLKPTAGYPVDAKRFKAEIAAKQAELGIDDHALWRSR